jgi:hypothetical protein
MFAAPSASSHPFSPIGPRTGPGASPDRAGELPGRLYLDIAAA